MKAFYLWCHLWQDSQCPTCRVSKYCLNWWLLLNQMSGSPAVISIRGHQRSTEFNISLPKGEQSVISNSKELWCSVGESIQYIIHSEIFRTIKPKQLSCKPFSKYHILAYTLKKPSAQQKYGDLPKMSCLPFVWRKVSQNLISPFLTFSVKLSPPHDFNSDK